MASIGDAELQLLVARQRAARQDALRSIDAALAGRHASAAAAIVARFASRRAALLGAGVERGEGAFTALTAEEAQEHARLIVEIGAEKRTSKKAALASMAARQREDRRVLRSRNRRHRILLAVGRETQIKHPPAPQLTTQVKSSARQGRSSCRIEWRLKNRYSCGRIENL